MSERRCSPSQIVIGLTGPIAAGKSTVAAMLRERGAEVIDADEVYRSLLTPGSRLSDQLVARFGPTILRPDGQIDRAALGEIVFADPIALGDLDRLTHPPVVAEVRRRLSQSRAPVVVIEAIKLGQSGLRDVIDRLWVVVAHPEVRLQRLMTRTNLDRETAERRLAAATAPLPGDIRVDAIIDASGDLEETAQAVTTAWDQLGVTPGPTHQGALAAVTQRERS